MRMKMKQEVGFREYMLSYKYLIVIAGISGTDRLNTFWAHSGTVIMLQEADFRYHYSAFLKPWVHYGTYDCGQDILLSRHYRIFLLMSSLPNLFRPFSSFRFHFFTFTSFFAFFSRQSHLPTMALTFLRKSSG